MLKLLVVVFALLAFGPSIAFAQGDATLDRAGDLQIGLGYSSANSDYLTSRINGLAFYADFDLRQHVGIEADFHQVSDSSGSQVYQRTYEIGARYFRKYGITTPYAKLLYGRGVFNFPYGDANLAYNLFALGGGVDFAVHPRFNVRVDYEYQSWLDFKPNGLTPTVLTIGVAYHFGPGILSTSK